MKKPDIIVKCLFLIFLLSVCLEAWSVDNRIDTLKNQISVLEGKKTQFEAEKQTLLAEGNELSYKIEDLKTQSKRGLGIIGRYKLSRALRKAQTLSKEIQSIDKELYSLENELKEKKSELEKEYEQQIAFLVEKLDRTTKTDEKKDILKRLKEYQSAKEQLAKQNRQELEYPNVGEIEIKEYDSFQEIREKADFINDYANKMSNEIVALDTRVKKLKAEFKTRVKVGEFADELSFFGERVSREEIVADSKKTEQEPGVKPTEESAGILTEKPAEEPTDKTADEQVKSDAQVFIRDANTATQPAEEPNKTTEPSSLVETEPVAEPKSGETTDTTPSKMVIERNGVSAAYSGTSLDQIEKEIKLLEKRRKELEKEKARLSEKAKSFYKKASEIEKSETRRK